MPVSTEDEQKNERKSASLSTWFVISVCLLATLGAVLMVRSAYQQKSRAIQKAERAEEPREYFKVAVADMPLNHRTHVEVTGTVKSRSVERDGDTHIQISDGKNFIMAECIPRLPCSVVPQVGQTVTVRGISRYDRENRWYEVHPVEEIEINK